MFGIHQKKVQSIKVFKSDSIGTFSLGLYILYLLKLPAPPRADLSGLRKFRVRNFRYTNKIAE